MSKKIISVSIKVQLLRCLSSRKIPKNKFALDRDNKVFENKIKPLSSILVYAMQRHVVNVPQNVPKNEQAESLY